MVFVFINLFLFVGSANQISYYHKKCLAQRVQYAKKQCNVLANQINTNGIRSYSTVSVTGEGGTNVSELAQAANNLGGRILLVDSHFKILADSYDRNGGQYLMTRETVRAMRGQAVSEREIGDDYMQVITQIIGTDTDEVVGVLIAAVSLRECNEMVGYLNGQRATLLGIFFIISLVFCFLLSLFIRNHFQRIQNELDIIVAGHQEENVSEEGLREFYNLSSAFNKILNRYKELERSRQEFVSNVSHELKTPITSMKILADSLLMQDNVPVEFYEEFMNDIVHEIDRENQIINDLLTLVKMDKTKADLNITQVNIGDLLEVLLKRLLPIAKKRDIDLHLATMRKVIADVDEVKLSLACNNIIENAVKYNKDGGKVDVSLNADHKFFYIRVKDTGCGIPEELKDQIFERFYRVDKARSRETGGTGLGLAITRNVILMHKGSIRVHSKEGEGSTFVIRIPLKYIG